MNKKWTLLTPVRAIIPNESMPILRINRVCIMNYEQVIRTIDKMAPGMDYKFIGFSQKPDKTEKGYACLRGSGEFVEEIAIKSVESELRILNVAELGYTKRGRASLLSVDKEKGLGLQEFLLLSSDEKNFYKGAKVGHYNKINFGDRWDEYYNYFFSHVVKIIQGETKVSSEWRQTLSRACQIIGRSWQSFDVVDAFLWNCVALETLLIDQNASDYTRTSQKLPKRIRSLFGWLGNWESGKYKDRIDSVYKKRNLLVHDGFDEEINVEDVEFLDELLLNILLNFSKHPELFGSKKSIELFTRRVEAAEILGIDVQIYPETFEYIARS